MRCYNNLLYFSVKNNGNVKIQYSNLFQKHFKNVNKYIMFDIKVLNKIRIIGNLTYFLSENKMLPLFYKDSI